MQWGRKCTLFNPADCLNDVADIKRFHFESDSRRESSIDYSESRFGRRNERFVTKIHRPRLDTNEVRVRVEATNTFIDPHFVGASGSRHRDQFTPCPDAANCFFVQFGSPARCSVIFAHVYVDNGRASRSRLNARLCDLLRCVGNVWVVLTRGFSSGRGHRDHHRISVPGLHSIDPLLPKSRTKVPPTRPPKLLP